MLSLPLAKIADLVDGRLVGDGRTLLTGAATIRDVRPGEITLADRIDLAGKLDQSPAAAVVVDDDFPTPTLPHVIVADVHEAFARIVSHFRPPRFETPAGMNPRALVSPTARIAANVRVDGGATIGDDVEIGAGSTIHAGVHIMAGCRVGEEVTIFPGAVLYENTIVGPRVVVHAGAVIGAYGFGYHTARGRHELSAQLGHVEIEADVEIGACTTIDRGTYGPTLIGEGTKIDNQVMIAHNCRIGRHNLLCSQVGIAGSTTTGDYVVMAGQVGVRDHVHIGEMSVLGAKAGVSNDIPAGMTYFGIPAKPDREQKLLQATLTKLPEMRKQLRALQRQLDQLTSQPKPEITPESRGAA